MAFQEGFWQSLSVCVRLLTWCLVLTRFVEAVYQNGVLRPLEELRLPEGLRVRIRIEGLFGLLKGWGVDAQRVKDELRGIHG